MSDFPHLVIETERLVLRPLTEPDLEPLHRLHMDPRVNRFIGGPPPPLEAFRVMHLEYIRTQYPRGFGTLGAFERNGGPLIGRCGLTTWQIDAVEELEVGYVFAKEVWGRGYATEAARAIRDFGFRTQPVDHLISLIDMENEPSATVAERTGMQLWKYTVLMGNPTLVYRIDRHDWERLPALG